MYADSKGNFFSDMELEALTSSEIQILGIHEVEMLQKKYLFDFTDDMTV